MARNELLALRIALRLISSYGPYENGDPLFGCSKCSKPVSLARAEDGTCGHLPACMHPVCTACYVDVFTLCGKCSEPVGSRCRPADRTTLMRELTQLTHALGAVVSTNQQLVDGPASLSQQQPSQPGKRPCVQEDDDTSAAPSATSLFGGAAMSAAATAVKPMVQQTLFGAAAPTATKGKTSRAFPSQYPSGKNKCFVCNSGWAVGEMICFVTGSSDKVHAKCCT